MSDEDKSEADLAMLKAAEGQIMEHVAELLDVVKAAQQFAGDRIDYGSDREAQSAAMTMIINASGTLRMALDTLAATDVTKSDYRALMHAWKQVPSRQDFDEACGVD